MACGAASMNVMPRQQDYAMADQPDHGAHPPISVVVCTRDRAELLQRCLSSLRHLDYLPYEVVVIDNASRDDATARVVAATPFRYVHEERPGLDWARNRGIAEARHDIIAYIDDDAQANSSWLQGLAAAFADPLVAAVTGLVVPSEFVTPAQRLFEQYGGMGKGITARQFQRASLRPHDLIAVHHLGVGANMAFRRKVFTDVGYFDTALDVGTPAWGGGDLDMFHRVLAAGLTLRYEPTAIVYHQHRRELAALRRQLYANGRSFGVYLLKVWKQQSVDRGAVAQFAIRWIGGWLVRRWISCLLGRLDFPYTLVWAELWGACSAPWIYYATYRHDRRMRQGA
jgi:glycosyltransferase involved in cell wall biosynthesis